MGVLLVGSQCTGLNRALSSWLSRIWTSQKKMFTNFQSPFEDFFGGGGEGSEFELYKQYFGGWSHIWASQFDHNPEWSQGKKLSIYLFLQGLRYAFDQSISKTSDFVISRSIFTKETLQKKPRLKKHATWFPEFQEHTVVFFELKFFHLELLNHINNNVLCRSQF